MQNQVNVVTSLQGRPLLLSLIGHFSVLVTKLYSCLVHVTYNSDSIVTINILHDKDVYDLNYTPHHEGTCRIRGGIQAYTYCKTPTSTTQFKNFRLLVLAFQVNHHHTYPISSRATQQAYTSTWHRDPIPLQLS